MAWSVQVRWAATGVALLLVHAHAATSLSKHELKEQSRHLFRPFSSIVDCLHHSAAHLVGIDGCPQLLIFPWTFASLASGLLVCLCMLATALHRDVTATKVAFHLEISMPISPDPLDHLMLLSGVFPFFQLSQHCRVTFIFGACNLGTSLLLG